jgi:hypothetical protein
MSACGLRPKPTYVNCRQLMQAFIAKRPGLWHEDIGI